MVLLMCFWSFNFNPSPPWNQRVQLSAQTAMCNQLRVVKSFQQVLSITKSFCRELNAKWGLLVSPGDGSCMAELAMQWMSTSALKRAYTWRISDIDFLENGCQSLESGFERHAICEI